MKNRLHCFTCCELWVIHNAVKDSKHQQFFPLKSQHCWLFTHYCLKNWKTQRFYWYDDYWLEWLHWLAFIGLWLTSSKSLLFLKSVLILFGACVLERGKKENGEDGGNDELFFSLNGEFRRSKDCHKDPIGWSFWL